MKKPIVFFLLILLLKSEGYTETLPHRPKAIVVGATSGMGRQLAKLLAKDYDIGLVSRRVSLLESLQAEIPTKSYIKQIDVAQHEQARQQLSELIIQIGGLDLMVIAISATNDNDDDESFKAKQRTIDVDLVGFWVMAETTLAFFEQQKSGHLVGFSSTSGLRGDANCPTYSGAKAFISRYLEANRNRMIQRKIPIDFTDIIPGWVEIEAIDVHKIPTAYWIATTQDAAQQIYEAITAKKKKAYITKRWELIAWLWNILPDCIYNADWWPLR
jgi:short-subunit dehydrogenase